MRKSSALLVAATTTAAVMTAGGPVAAAPNTYAEPVVSWVGPTVLATTALGGAAMVSGRYQCWGGDQDTHIFVAVKQGAEVSPENPSSESQVLHAFYSTNWGSDGPSLKLHCDGASHRASFRVLPDPYWVDQDPTKQLVDGPALVQYCVFDAQGGFAMNYSMQTVRVLH